MQTLEFILTRIILFRFSQLVNRCQCLRIVCGKLRINLFRCSEKFLRTCNIRQVSMDFLSKYRIVRHTFNLGFFNLTIPVSTFNQTDHQTFFRTFCQINQIIDQIEAAFLVSLNNKANTFPLGQRWLET